MIKIEFYETASFDNVVDKVLTSRGSFSSVQFLEPYDEESPTLKLKTEPNYFSNINYCKIYDDDNVNTQERFTHYYFIRGVQYKSHKISFISCEMDYLMTYKSWIYEQRAIVTRSDLLEFDEDGSGVESSIKYYSFKHNYAMGDIELEPTMGKQYYTFPKENGSGTAAFVDPQDTRLQQEAKGVFVITTVQTGYHTGN